jgi:superfamily II DNA or RNA helicase
MNIRILDHNFAEIEEPTPRVRELLSYENKMYNKNTKRWKTTTHCLIDKQNIILTGLASYVAEHTPNVTITDQREYPDPDYQVPQLFDRELREYQIQFLVKALKDRRMIIDVSTAAGKTTIAAAILDALNLPTLIIAPNKTVLNQLKTDLSALLPHRKFGVISSEKVDWQEIMIGLAGSLTKLPNPELQQFKVLMVDEAHGCAASRPMDIILRSNAPYRFGFTGTSTGRSDNRDLVTYGLLGHPVKLIDSTELTEQGYLAPTTVDFHYAGWEGDYVALEDALIVNNIKRNELIIKIVNQHKKDTILLLIKRREHGRILSQMIKGSTYVSGDTPGEEREQIRHDVMNGKIRVLIATNVFAMGLDIPNITLGINAVGDKAEILTRQRIGRIMRPWQELCKKWIDIYDVYTNTLEKHAKDRLKMYKDAKIEVNFIGFTEGKKASLE